MIIYWLILSLFCQLVNKKINDLTFFQLLTDISIKICRKIRAGTLFSEVPALIQDFRILLNKGIRERNIFADAKLQAEESGTRSQDIPFARRRTIHRNVGFPVAVVISGNGFIRAQSELDDRRRITAAVQDIPDSARRAINRRVRPSVAVVIRRNCHVSALPPLNGAKRIALRTRRIPPRSR